MREALHQHQSQGAGDGLAEKQYGKQAPGPVRPARADVVAHHRDAAGGKAHGDGDHDLKELHHNAHHGHGDLGVLFLTEDRIQSSVLPDHVVDRGH